MGTIGIPSLGPLLRTRRTVASVLTVVTTLPATVVHDRQPPILKSNQNRLFCLSFPHHTHHVVASKSTEPSAAPSHCAHIDGRSRPRHERHADRRSPIWKTSLWRSGRNGADA